MHFVARARLKLSTIRDNMVVMNSRSPGSAAATLFRARKEAHLTQEDLGARAGVTQSTISMYESGHREPSIAMLQKLIRAAGRVLVIGLEPSQGPLLVLPDTPRARHIRKNGRAIKSLAARAGVSNVRVFGSVARGEDAGDSDIDLVVDVAAGTGLFRARRFSTGRVASSTPLLTSCRTRDSKRACA